MPIASIRASLANRGEAFAQIGTIRKGGPKVNRNGFETVGPDLDHFRFVFDEHETAAAALIAELYGAEPNNIRIRLPFPDVDKVWEFWLEAYVAGAMICRAGKHPHLDDDGEYICYQIDPRTSEKIVLNWRSVETGEPVKYIGQAVHAYRNKRGETINVYPRPVGRLSVILPELRRLVYLIVQTTSWHDCENIDRQLHALDTVQRMRGQSIAGVPLILRRRLDEISTPSGSDGNRARRKKWLISIEADPTWVDLSLRQLEQAAVPVLLDMGKLPSQLPAPDRGPDLNELDRLEEEEESDEVPETDPMTYTDRPEKIVETPPEAQTTYETLWPAAEAEYGVWLKAHGWNGKETRDVLGTDAKSWLKQHPGTTWADVARTVAAQLAATMLEKES